MKQASVRPVLPKTVQDAVGPLGLLAGCKSTELAHRVRGLRAGGLIALWVLGLWGLGCQPAAQPVEPEVLAKWDGGQLKVADLDAYLLRLPVAERQPPATSSTAEWLRLHLDRLFERRHLLSSPEAEALADDETFASGWASKRDDILMRRYLQRHNQSFEVSGQEILAYFEAHRDDWHSPERRIFQNLLLAFPASASAEQKDAICERAEELRRQLVDGASFDTLVRQHSDSSNAATGGLVSALSRDQLRGEVGELLFALEPGAISRVLRNRAGCQLFRVRQVIPAVEPQVELLQEEIANLLGEERRAIWLRELMEKEATAQGVDLPEALDGTDWQALPADEVIFSLGEDVVTLRSLLPAIRQGKTPEKALAEQVSRLLFIASMENLGPEVLDPLLAAAKEGFSQDYLRRLALRDHLTRQPEELLRQAYDNNKGRYMSDPRLELTLYSWPIGGGDPLAYLERPRRFAEALKENPQTAAELWQAESEATAAEQAVLPQMGLRDLFASRPELSAALMEEHVEGAVLGPHRSGRFIYVVQINVYIPPRQLSFLEVQQQVRADFISEHGEAMAAEWSRSLAEDQGWVVFEDNLDLFGQRLVEQLTRGAD